MSASGWATACLFLAFLAGGVASLMGPFHLDEGEHPDQPERSARVKAWLAGWPHRPRAPIRASDWEPHGGRLFLPTLAAIALTYSGVWVLVGSGQTFRMGAALALAGGLLLDVLLVAYFRRPKWPESTGALFKTSRPGYRADEVDAFFATLNERSREDIRRATFRMASAGYDVDSVDDAMAIAARSRELRSRMT